MNRMLRCLILLSVGVASMESVHLTHAQEKKLDRFEVKKLTGIYYSEGVGAGDLDRDGDMDVVYGPHWYEGPEFTTAHEIYSPVPQNTEGYSDHFFAWVHDFDNDGWNDIFVVGFPAKPAYVYRNPGATSAKSHWEKYPVFDSVSNESPHFIQLVGDPRPELVCTRDGFFGYATVNWDKPFEPWKFHAISAQVTDKQFGHGLGVGDVNADGLLDIVYPGGWFQQPKELSDAKPWRGQEASFTNAYGGAEMHVYDVDGDGDNDVIASQAAHEYGLAWFEQIKKDEAIEFVRHDIMGKRPADNRYGLVFTEPHSVQLADMDGDGLKDIITGKTYYSHHKRSPMWDAGAVVYWFKLTRTAEGIDWIPYLAAPDCGIGRQVGIADLNADGLLDIYVGGMKGSHVLLHQQAKVDEATWLAAQPTPYVAEPVKSSDNDNAMIFEGEKLQVVRVTDGAASEQQMGGFSADHWSNDSQLWWTQGKLGSQLRVALPVKVAGEYDVRIAFTKARDYGTVQVWLDDKKIGGPLDLFHSPEVISTGLVSFGVQKFEAGPHELVFEIIGKNAKADPGYMVGIDVVQLGNSRGELPKGANGEPLNLDFERGDLTHWTAVGEAFQQQPIEGDTVAKRRPDMKSEHQGTYWIGGFEKKNDSPQGTLTSDPFVLTSPYISFLIGGGSHPETRMEIVDQESGSLLFKATGRNSESMRWVVADLSSSVGKRIFVRLVDGVSGGWGHINFDDVRLHATQPGPISQPDSPLVADEYPHRGLAAEEAAKAMRVPEGFRVTVGAAEPEVLQPIAMALDDRGRVWIAEAYEYPNRSQEKKGRDRILIFEDTDGNGSLDRRKVFAEGLNLVSGLEVGFGGVWVGAAPYLLFIPDANRDDQPDAEPQILLDGWGYQDTHETLNAFIWGPDGWLYGCHGVFTHSRVGKPGTPDDQRIPINAGVWRYHPTKHRFEVFAHGTSNPWGVDFNDRGQAFVTACVIPHLYHMIQGGRYERQASQHFNPYTYDDLKTVADHFHYLGATPHSGNGKSDSAGGGHAHSGAMFYLGGAWPAEYRDRLFMNNIHGQRLNVDYPEAKGSGYVGKHAPDFLLTGDQASQILNLRYGPDGQAWMIDWYDMQACHLNDPTKHDRSNGRIYKIQYGQVKSQVVNLERESDDVLIAHLESTNDWYARHARRLLQERAAKGTLASATMEQLGKRALQTRGEEPKQLRYLWALASVNGLTETRCRELLNHPRPFVRAWTIQLAMDSGSRLDCLAAGSLAKMAATEKSPVVRLYLASAAQKLPAKERWDLLITLAKHPDNRDDHNLPLMLWFAAEPLAAVEPRRALALGLEMGATVPVLRQFMLRRLGANEGEEGIPVLVEGLSHVEDSGIQLEFLDALRGAMAGQRRVQAPKSWAEAYSKLILSKSERVRIAAQSLGVTFGHEESMQQVRDTMMAQGSSTEGRLASLNALLAAKDPQLVPILVALLDDPAMRNAAIAGMAQYSDPRIGEALLKSYASWSPADKRTALSTLAARGDSAVAMLKAVADKRIPATDLSADLVRQLQFLKQAEIQSLLASTWGTARETPAEKAKLIDEYKKLVQAKSTTKADEWLGRTIFAKTCQQCHTFFGTGNKIGPDLTGSNRANLDYLLSNIVDPSGVMAKEYQPTILLTDDGRVVTGLVRSEDSKAIVIQTADKLETIPLDEIEKRQLSEQSMMPEDQLKAFSPFEVRSLMAYLAHDRQVPMLATKENVGSLFNGQDLNGWRGNADVWRVDQGEIVGSSKGLDKNEFLISDMAATDFRLSLEVKLVDNQGNSGIQFRSQPLEHGILGYQADVGPGWWGKLYEEEGRGVMSDVSGEAHVKVGDWNLYEIEAVKGRTRTWLNGKPCTDLDDPQGAKRGIFALQVHSGGPTEVRFRNLKLEIK